jgi:hypothetical protein
MRPNFDETANVVELSSVRPAWGRDDATALIIRAGELLRLATETSHAAVKADLEYLALRYLNLADRLEFGAARSA